MSLSQSLEERIAVLRYNRIEDHRKHWAAKVSELLGITRNDEQNRLLAFCSAEVVRCDAKLKKLQP